MDVMHSRANFAMPHDFDSADAFSDAYRWHSGILDDDQDAQVFWAISDIVGFLPDPESDHCRTDPSEDRSLRPGGM
jgi:hypothetical protein